MGSAQPGCRRRQAFTLIELLVTLGVPLFLGVVVLPALRTARILSERQACVGNLGQIGKALGSYVGDYAGYYPCWAGYGGPPKAGPANYAWAVEGQYQDVRVGSWVPSMGRPSVMARRFTHSGIAWFGVCSQRTVAVGSRRPNEKFGIGNLNAAPINLGFLLVGSYLDSMDVLWCPSGSEMPLDIMYYNPKGKPCQPPNGVFNLLRGIAKAKDARKLGTDGRYLTHGDWTVNEQLPGVGIEFRKMMSKEDRHWKVLQCTYAYRNAAVFDSTPKIEHPREYVVPFTKKPIRTQSACPLWKTERLLAGRALVSDAFSNFARNGYPGYIPGYGVYAHKECYHVLYGDGHVNFFGDPRQRIAYWPTNVSTQGRFGDPLYSNNLANNCPYGRDGNWEDSAQPVWHVFDQTAGYDTDVPGLGQ